MRSLQIRKPTVTQLRVVHRLLQGPLQPWQRRRAETLLLFSAGQNAVEIARLLEVHPNTTYADLRAFQQNGVRSLQPSGPRGRPPRLTRAHLATIWRLADQPPTAVGLPWGRWSLARMRAYLLRQRLVPAISREHLRRVLKRKGFRFRRVRRKLLGEDPHRPAILRRLRRQWQQRPRGGIFAFFDVQPIAVKAYGGRRYTREPQLVLPRNQKTRGRFYLFTLYEVNHGRTRWGFYPGKGAKYVCQFMRRVRRWYPRQPVRIALDRDPAHPCKAQQTRRTMRRLRLRWTSMPKGSPDDNPVETLFSDVQQMVLDNSDDAEPRTTQRRISDHYRRRNRRRDRFIRIGYLMDSHKH